MDPSSALQFGQIAGQQVNRFLQPAKDMFNTFNQMWLNKKSSDYQFKKDKEMWNMANEYNSPVNQMNRLKQAGINPSLAFGSGSVAGNTSTQTPKYQMTSPTVHNMPSEPLNVIGVLSQYQDYKSRQVQTNNLEEQNLLIKQQQQKQMLENAYLAKTLGYRINQSATAEQKGYQNLQIGKWQESLGEMKHDLFYNTRKYQQSSIISRSQMDALKYQQGRLDYDLAKMGINKNDSLFLRIMANDQIGNSGGQKLIPYQLMEGVGGLGKDLIKGIVPKVPFGSKYVETGIKGLFRKK